MAYEWHHALEGKSFRFTLWTMFAIAVGGIVLLIPPFFMQGTVEPLEGYRRYSALQQEGRDIYIREGCNVCHSQQVRPLRSETARYGPYSLAGEGVHDRPFLYGSRRTGPDLARVGGKYPDSWHWIHFENPQQIEPRSNMPSFAFLLRTPLDTGLTARRLEVQQILGTPYEDSEIANAVASAQAEMAEIAASLRRDGIELDEIGARSEGIALIAYLQHLGHAVKDLPEGGAK